MIDEEKFKDLIGSVIGQDDKVIVLYSGLWTFVDKLEFKINNVSQIPYKILGFFEDKIGKDKLLLLPSFSGKEFRKNKIFDIKNSLDRENGVLSKAALKKGYFRTKQPIHSYLAFGDTSKLKKEKFTSSWGENSLLEFFSKNDARICNLGLPWNKGCSYLHKFEENFKVPWRYHKKFSAKIIKNNRIIGNCSEIKYCSPNQVELKYDYYPFIKYIQNAKSFKKAKNKSIKIESIKTSCLDKIGKKIFKKNKWIIVKNKKKIKKWIQFDKLNEIKKINYK